MDEILRMDKLAIGPHDVLILTLGASYQPSVAADFASYLSEAFGAQVVILTKGATLQSLSEKDLYNLGLVRLGAGRAVTVTGPTATDAPSTALGQGRLSPSPSDDSYGTRLSLARQHIGLTRRQVVDQLFDGDFDRYYEIEEDITSPTEHHAADLERLLGERYETTRERAYREALEQIQVLTSGDWNESNANFNGLKNLLRLSFDQTKDALATPPLQD